MNPKEATAMAIAIMKTYRDKGSFLDGCIYCAEYTALNSYREEHHEDTCVTRIASRILKENDSKVVP